MDDDELRSRLRRTAQRMSVPPTDRARFGVLLDRQRRRRRVAKLGGASLGAAMIVALVLALMPSSSTRVSTLPAATAPPTTLPPTTAVPTTPATTPPAPSTTRALNPSPVTSPPPTTVPIRRATPPTTTPPTTTPPTTTPTTTASTTPPPPASTPTPVQVFEPWVSPGTLKPGIHVVNRIAGTDCTMGSNFDVGNPYAWRCFEASGGFYDPCFAPAGASNITQVACVDSPWMGVTLMTLARPLAHSSHTVSPAEANYPWAMLLANSQQCELIEGTAPLVDGAVLNYGCRGGYASYPKLSTEPWTVSYGAGGAHSLVSVAVTTAWA